MQDAGEGVIVFVSSQAALIGIYGLAAYCGSKYAVRGFAEALAMEVRPHGIRVTVCCPPDTDTPGFEEEQGVNSIDIYRGPVSGPEPCPTHFWSFETYLNL